MQKLILALLIFSMGSAFAQSEPEAATITDTSASSEASESTITEESEAATETARTTWTLGTGFEARMQREVNPDYAEMAAMGQLFVQVNRGRFGGHLEVSQEERNTSSGALHVDTTSTNVGAWGRYSVLLERPWHPYFTGGVGSYFDQVKSSYESSSIEKNGRRLYWGLGVGISRTFWRHLLVEAEGRGALVEDRKDPMFSGLIRVGVQI